MPALGGPGPRRVNARAVAKRERAVAKLPKAAPKRAAVYVAPARAYKPTPVSKARRYVNAPVAQRRSTLQTISAKVDRPKPSPRPVRLTSDEQRIVRTHAARHTSDVKTVKALGFLPRSQERSAYGYTPKASLQPAKKPTVKPDISKLKTKPGLTAAIATNPKLKKQALGMLSAGKSPEAVVGALAEQKQERSGVSRAAQTVGLKALDYPMRPGYAALGSIKKDIERGGISEVLAVHAPGSKAAKERRTAVKRGIQGKDRTTGSDVLKTAGVKNKAVRAVAGFGLDIVANPLTYMTGGAGTVAERAGAVAARKAVGITGRPVTRAAARHASETALRREAELPTGPLTKAQHKQVQRGAAKRRIVGGTVGRPRRAAARRAAVEGIQHAAEAQARREVSAVRAPIKTSGGRVRPTKPGETSSKTGLIGPLTKAQHETVKEAGEQAVRKIEETARAAAQKVAPKGKGITIKVAGTEVPGLRRGTAFVGRHTGKAIPKPLKKVTRGAARTFRPTIAAEGYAPEQFQGGLHAAASARTTAADAEERAITLAREVKAKIPEEDFPKVIDALERDRLGKLPAEYRGVVHDLRSAFREYHRKGRRANVIKGEVGDFGNWLKQGDLRKMLETVKAETRVQTRGLGQATIRLQRAGSNLAIAETEAAGRQRVGVVQLTAAERRRQDLAHERELGTARVGAERARGGQALGTQRQLQVATQQLKAELKKPVAKRKGVAALEARIQRLRPPEPSERVVAAGQRLAEAKGPRPRVTQQSALRAAEERGQALPSATSVRVEKATARRGEHEADVETRKTRTQASKDIPVKSASESDKTYLKRVVTHAQEHDLPLLEQRATRLLESKPTMTRGYFPREFQTRVNRKFGVRKEPTGRVTGEPISQLKVTKVTAGHKRAEQRPLREVNPERIEKGQEPHSTDIPTVTVSHFRDVGQASGQGQFAQKMGDLGRGYKEPTPRPGEPLADFFERRAQAANQFTEQAHKAGEQVYFVGPKDGKFGLHPVSKVDTKTTTRTRTSAQAETKSKEDPGWVARQALEPTEGRAAGRYVALNKQLVDELHDLATRPQSPEVLAQYDRLLGKWKGAAIGSPAFHIRNAIGDLHTASYEQPLLKVAGMASPFGSAGRAVRRRSALGRVTRPSEAGQATKFQRFTRKIGLGVPDENTTIKVGGRRMSLDQFNKEAAEDGIPGAGRIGGEVRELAHSGIQDVEKSVKGPGEGAKPWLRVGKPGKPRRLTRTLSRWSVNRENVMRYVTYKGMRDKGHSRQEAARIANELHIDYAHLSATEKEGLRRLFPFYTWTARTIPLTAKKYVTRPGKFAAFESLRQETGKAFTGMTEEQQRAQMTPAQQRQLPFTIKVPGVKDPIGVSWSDPFTLLGNLPFGKEFPEEVRRLGTGMLTPGFKWPAELLTGKNIVTKGDIEGKKQPVAPATIVNAIKTGAIPRAVQDQLKIIPPRGSIPGKPKDGGVDPKTGKPAWVWRGYADYAHDQALLGLGGQLAGAIGSGRSPLQSKGQALSALAGLRVEPLDKAAIKTAAERPLRSELDRLYSRRTTLNNGNINASNPNPEFKRIQKRINELNKKLNPRPKKPRKTGGLGGGLGGGGLGGGLKGGGLG